MVHSFRRINYLICLVLFFQVGCTDDSLIPVSRISQDVKPFLLDFLNEARSRNVEIDTTNFEVVLVERFDDGFYGACGLGFFDYQGTGINRIEILDDEDCWKGRSDLEKENLVFHEIGHAVLGRFHTEEFLPNGAHKSIMCGGCNNFSVYEESTLFKRAYYLDELLDDATPNPTWARIKTVKSTIFSDNLDAEELAWEFVTTDGVANNNNYEGKLVDSRFVSSPQSLLISSQRIDDTQASARWQLILDQPNIPPLSNVILSCQIQSESVQGIGANIALLGFVESEGETTQVVYKSSFSTRNILGSESFAKYELSILCFPENVDRLEIHFEIQPNTIGQIYLDDVQLVVHR